MDGLFNGQPTDGRTAQAPTPREARMSDWTIDPPTRSGWYWLAQAAGQRRWQDPQIAQVTVDHGMLYIRCALDAMPLPPLPAERALNSLRWLGPVAEPRSPSDHATTLHDVVVAARAFVNANTPRNDADGEREALVRALAETPSARPAEAMHQRGEPTMGKVILNADMNAETIDCALADLRRQWIEIERLTRERDAALAQRAQADAPIPRERGRKVRR